MTKHDHTTTLWALDIVRRFAPAPLVGTTDFHVEIFRRQCERDAALREAMGFEEAPAEPMDAESHFWAEQCPSEASFK